MSEPDEKMFYPAGITSEDDMQAAMREPWHPELLPYVREGVLGWEVAHPLVQTVAANPGLTSRVYAATKQVLTEALEAEAWDKVVFIHARPYRLEALREHVLGEARRLVDVSPEVRELATSVWLDSENTHEHRREWKALFSGWTPEHGLLLATAEDHKAFEHLPDDLEIFRGTNKLGGGGWSWSLSEDTARWFAQRYFSKNRVLRASVPKREVFGFINDREESEILVHPERVSDVRWLS